MTIHQRARTIVRDYESDALEGVIAFGFAGPKPIQLVYYTDRSGTVEAVREKLESGAFVIGWVGVKRNDLFMRVPSEMKEYYLDAVEHLQKIARELISRSKENLH